MLRFLAALFACVLSSKAATLPVAQVGENSTDTLVSYEVPSNVAPSFALPPGPLGPAGATWTAQPNSGSRYWTSITSSADGTKLAAVAESRLYTSADSGANWAERVQIPNWRCIASSADGTKLVGAAMGSGESSKIFTSTDSGVSWTTRANHYLSHWVSVASSSDGTKLAALVNNDWVYTSTNSGVSWTARTKSHIAHWRCITSSADGTKLAAVAESSPIYTSSDSGATWTAQQQSGSRDWFSITSSADGTKLAAVVDGGQIYTSTNSGKSWIARESTRDWFSIASSADGTRLAAVARGWFGVGKIYTSTDSGVTWALRESSRDWKSIVSSSDGTKLAAFVGHGQVYTSIGAMQPYPITVVADSGPATFNSFATSISAGPPSESGQTVRFIVTNDNNPLFATQPTIDASGSLTFTPEGASGNATITVIAHDTGGTADGGVDMSIPQTFTITITPVPPNVEPSFRLPDSGKVPLGESWAAQLNAGIRNWVSITSSADGTKLAAVVQDGQIYTSEDSGKSWIARESNRHWASITSSADGTRLAAVERGWFGVGKIYTSTDSGVTWALRESSRDWKSIVSSADGTKLAALVGHGPVYTSMNSGMNWTARDIEGEWSSIASSADGAKLAAVQSYGPVYVSTDFGATWTARDTVRVRTSIASSADGSKLVAGGGIPNLNSAHIYTSRDFGMSWTERGADQYWDSIVSSADGTTLAAISEGKIYTSRDSGVTWTAYPNLGIRNWTSPALSADGTKLAIAEQGGYIYILKEVHHDITVTADSGQITSSHFATNISAGPPRESGQAVNFTVTNDNQVLFSGQPAIDASGNLTFTPLVSASGTAIVEVTALDNGGTVNGGIDTSAPQRFTITIVPKIVVSGKSALIADKDVTPSSDDHTDYDTVPLTGQWVTRRFTIANSGPTSLHLTGEAAVQIAGDAAKDFKVTTQPALSLAQGGSTHFDITFDPTQPGRRIATVVIATDDPSLPAFTFAITGFGRLSKLLNQTITFSLPPRIHWDGIPVVLNASSTSGLPVSFRLVSGPATLSGNRLVCNLPGAIKVEASQVGAGNYTAAPPVIRTINVVHAPAERALLIPSQIYDGSPKPISPPWDAAGASITYRVNGIAGAIAPIDVGSYSATTVYLGITKTGPLVIAKAPLYVTPDDQRKFAGQLNPTLTYKITGFRGTDTEAVVAKMPVLRTTAIQTSPGGEYAITASGAEAQNYTFIYQQGALAVESFAGRYEALLLDGSSSPIGKLSVTVTSSSTAFTASLTTGTESSAVSFAGRLVTVPVLEHAMGSAMTLKSGIEYALQFTLPLKGKVTARAMRNGSVLGSANDGQKLSTAKALYAGAHTVIMEPATPAAAHIPVGAGWATADISSTGMLTMTGKLGDGTAFTCTVSPDEMMDPGYRMFVQPYLDINSQASSWGGRYNLPGQPKFIPRTQSFLAGSFNLMPHPVLPNLRHVAAADMIWKKTGVATDASYRSGFGTVNTVLMLDPWQKPVAAIKTVPAVTLQQRLGLITPYIAVAHSASGSAADVNLPTRLGINPANVGIVDAPFANLTKWKITTFNATNGTFTGSFELVDGVTKRPVTFSGILRQPAESQDALIGGGHYLLPPMTGAEKSTGEVNFQRP